MARSSSFRFDVWLVTIAPLVAIAGLLFHFAPRLPLTPLRLIGYILLLSGVAMLTVARFNLGNSFSVDAKARQLVTTGIYSRIRHPVYVFSAIALAGAALIADRPLLLLLLIPIGILQVRRAHREEAVLEETFGQAYRDYRSRTWL